MPKNDLFLEDFPELTEAPRPTWKHRAFYNFLEISPSYYQVYLFKKKKISLQKIKKLEQYEKVLETYDLVGDIYNLSFENWWKTTGFKLFDPIQNFEALFKINLKKSLAYNQELLKIVYEKKKKDLLPYITPMSFEKNKIQELVLSQRLQLIDAYIDKFGMQSYKEETLNKRLPKWFIGYLEKEKIFGRTSAASFDQIKSAIRFEKSSMGYFLDKPAKKRAAVKNGLSLINERPFLKPVDIKNTTSKNAHKAKRYLSMLMSKHKREALILAENAARGTFPSKEMLLKSYPNFDFEVLRNAPEFQGEHPKNNYSSMDLKSLHITGSNSRTKRKFYADLQNTKEVEHQILEKIDTDLKETIKEKAFTLYEKEYRKRLPIAQKKAKLTRRHSGS